MINKICRGLFLGGLILSSILVLGLFFAIEIYNIEYKDWVVYTALFSVIFYSVIFELSKEEK